MLRGLSVSTLVRRWNMKCSAAKIEASQLWCAGDVTRQLGRAATYGCDVLPTRIDCRPPVRGESGGGPQWERPEAARKSNRRHRFAKLVVVKLLQALPANLRRDYHYKSGRLGGGARTTTQLCPSYGPERSVGPGRRKAAATSYSGRLAKSRLVPHGGQQFRDVGRSVVGAGSISDPVLRGHDERTKLNPINVRFRYHGRSSNSVPSLNARYS